MPLVVLSPRELSGPLKQPVVVENVGGAGGTLGAARGARAQPDGYTLTLTHLGHAASVTLYRKLSYNPIDDFEPIGAIAVVPMVVVGPKSSTAKDIVELIAQIKSKKDGMTIANGGHRFRVALLRHAVHDCPENANASGAL